MLEHHLNQISSCFLEQTELMRFWLGHPIECLTTLGGPEVEKAYKEDHITGSFMFPVCFVINGEHYAFYNVGNDCSHITIAQNNAQSTGEQWHALMFGANTTVAHNILAPMRQVVDQVLEDILVICQGEDAIGLAFVTSLHQLWLINPGAYYNTIIHFESPFVLSEQPVDDRHIYPTAQSVDV